MRRWQMGQLGVVASVGVLAGLVLGEGRVGGEGPTLKNGPYRDYKQWTRVNDTPVFSATHGESFVVSYVNPMGLRAALEGTFPLPRGTVIVKEAFENDGCKPGAPGAVFVMEKRAPGYDPQAGGWHWVRYSSDGTLWGEGTSGGQVGFCAACHQMAKVNDYVFGNGTRIKATETMPLAACR